MIDFMALSLPRSGSTWVANWLTTDTTICYHDPVFTYLKEDLDNIESNKSVGVSCTALAFFTEWINNHPSKKVILHRDMNEINKSLIEIGLTAMPSNDFLEKVDGLHVHWLDIFDQEKAAGIAEYLGVPFDPERHDLLKEMSIQPEFDKVTINRSITKRFIKEITACL